MVQGAFRLRVAESLKIKIKARPLKFLYFIQNIIEQVSTMFDLLKNDFYVVFYGFKNSIVM